MDPNSNEEMKLIFDFLDKDGSGALDEEELQCGMSILKINLAGVQIKNIMKLADINTDSKVDFEEFVKLCFMGASKDKLKSDDLINKLAPYDRDNDGKIDVNDLKMLLTGEGEPLDDEDLEEIINDLKIESDGKTSIKDMIYKFFS